MSLIPLNVFSILFWKTERVFLKPWCIQHILNSPSWIFLCPFQLLHHQVKFVAKRLKGRFFLTNWLHASCWKVSRWSVMVSLCPLLWPWGKLCWGKVWGYLFLFLQDDWWCIGNSSGMHWFENCTGFAASCLSKEFCAHCREEVEL